MNETIPVAVLAAGKISPELQQATGADTRALIPVGGRPIIDRLLDAVMEAKLIDGVKVVCAEGSPLIDHLGDLAVVAQGPEYLDSIRAGLDAFPEADRVFIVTGDLPLMTAEALDHFCGEVLHSDASIIYSIVRKEDCERVFPGGRRTYFRLQDGLYTGGNVGVVSRGFMAQHGHQLQKTFEMRKSPLRLCTLLGWGFVMRLLLGRLSLEDIAGRIEQLLGSSAHVIRSPYPEIGFDVDKPSNVASVEAWLRSRAS